MTTELKHNYADLGKKFSLPTLPEQVSKPTTLLWNSDLAHELGIDIEPQLQASLFSGQKLIKGSSPVAMAYSGHQFGQFNPHLGDGRAHLLGEINDNKGNILELHLKGSGRTPFSRNGDGKCAMQPAIREFIMSEAMHALGVPTTRCLSVVSTGEDVIRQTQAKGAVVCRVATSHLRVGTFEYFAARNMSTEVKMLADYAIKRHFPQIDINNKSKYINLLSQVIDKQINLVVEWMRVGFIHGVMNTDNSLLSGETIDYGPCAMLGTYDLHTVFSSIDHQGRYAFGNQPSITQWNLSRFAECLLPLINTDEQLAVKSVTPILEMFSGQYKRAFNSMMATKIGIDSSHESPLELINGLLALMQRNQLDYTQTFNELADILSTSKKEPSAYNAALKSWAEQWITHLKSIGINETAALALMRARNPVVIPRNHHIERILSETEQSMNPDRANQFIDVLRSPYEILENTHKFQDPSPDGDLNYQTFCGT